MLAAVGRVGEPDAAVGMGHGVVGRVEPLALERVGDAPHRAVELVADHAPPQMLAGDLPPLEVEGVAVAVVRRQAEDRHAAVVLDPAQLPVVRDVAPDQVAALSVPGRPLGPERPGPQALDGRVRLRQAVERRVDRDDVGVPEIDVRRGVRSEIARRAGDRAGRRDRAHVLLAQRGAGADRQRAGADSRGAHPREKAAPVEVTSPLVSPADRLGQIDQVLAPWTFPLPPWLNAGHLLRRWHSFADAACPVTKRGARIRDSVIAWLVVASRLFACEASLGELPSRLGAAW